MKFPIACRTFQIAGQRDVYYATRKSNVTTAYSASGGRVYSRVCESVAVAKAWMNHPHL